MKRLVLIMVAHKQTKIVFSIPKARVYRSPIELFYKVTRDYVDQEHWAYMIARNFTDLNPSFSTLFISIYLELYDLLFYSDY